MASPSGFDRGRAVVLGLTVLLLYGVFVTAVFSGFASYIYRTEWQATVAQSAQGQDLDNLIYILKRERFLEGRIAADYDFKRELTSKRADLEAEQKKAFAQIARAKAKRDRMSHTYFANVRAVEKLLTAADRSAVQTIAADGNLSAQDKSLSLLNLVQNAASGLSEPDKAALVAVAQKIQTTQAEQEQRVKEANDSAHEINALLVLNQSEKEELLTRINTHQKKLTALQDRVSLGAPERARLDALSVSVPFVGDVFQRLVGFPTIFLTLIVTIAAGGLGTVVSFSRRYYAHPETPNLPRLFVNVGEGIAAAIAIFLFSGAGMLALTQGSGAQNSVELSPYTVAFVAFLSGFMAEEAFGAIQKAGKRIFKGQDDDDDPDKKPKNDRPDPLPPAAKDAPECA